MVHENCIQIAYASTATFGDGQIESPQTQRVVFNIVRRSRANNPGWGVVGALYFGDGYFLQILEGAEENVDRLFAVIQQDDRHRDLQVLKREPIAAPQFGRWSMKFPTMDEDIRGVLGLDLTRGFNPYDFDDARLQKLIGHLLETEEAA